ARVAGPNRVRDEPQACAAVLAACAGLPLAIRIAGARLAGRPGWTVQTLAARLADERGRLDELAVGDLAVRSSFQVTYENLPAIGGQDAARCFQLLGLQRGREVGLPAIAALLGERPERVERDLEVL